MQSMNKFYFGRYIQQENPSFIHKLNPLIKFIIVSISATCIFYFGRDIFSFIILTIIWAILIILSGNIFLPALKSLKSFKVLYIFIFITVLFFGEQGNFHILFTKNDLLKALSSLYQFILLIGFSSILSLTSSPSEITKALYLFIKPLKIFKVNVENIGLSLLIAVRFIPLLFEESSKIITAQKLRGVWITDKTFKEKIKFILNIDSLIIPLFIRVFHYAEQLSITAEYRTNISLALKLNALTKKDILFLLLFLMVTTLFYGLYYYGKTKSIIL